jgi:hypothetical protein
MPYSSVDAAKKAGFNTTLNGAALTLGQINNLAAIYDKVKAAGTAEVPMAVAIATFKKTHKKAGDGWVLKESGNAFTSTWREEIGDLEYLEEAVTDAEPKRALKLTVLKAGFSQRLHEARRGGRKYPRFYSNAAVESALPLAEGLPVYVGNSTDHNAIKRLEDRVGTLRNAEVVESGGIKAVRGDLKVLPHKTWVYDLAKDDPKAFGPSIEAGGRVRCPVEIEGKASALVESIGELTAALLVENPAAGGKIETIYESTEQGGERMKLEELTESERKELLTEAREIVTAELDVKAKDDKIKELEEAAETEKAKHAELMTKLNEAKSVELIEAAFPEELPDVAKEKLRESLKAETDGLDLTDAKDQKLFEAKVKETVEKEAEYIATLAEAGKVKGMGGGAPDKREAFVEASTKRVLGMAGVKPEEPEEKK